MNIGADYISWTTHLPGMFLNGRFSSRKQYPSVFRNAGKERHLFAGNGSAAAEGCEMRHPNIGEESVIRRGDLLQGSHLSGLRDTDFQNAQWHWFFSGQDSQRKSQLAVVASRGGQDRPFGKKCLQNIFDNGFS